MAATPESRSKDALRKVLTIISRALPPTPDGAHVQGLWWWWLQPGYGQQHGPDLLGRIDGAFFAVEAKADPSENGRPPRPGQARELNAITLSGKVGGQWVGVVGTAESFDAWRRWMLRHLPLQYLNSEQLQALHVEVVAVPWRTAAIRAQRQAPPVMRIRTKKPSP